MLVWSRVQPPLAHAGGLPRRDRFCRKGNKRNGFLPVFAAPEGDYTASGGEWTNSWNRNSLRVTSCTDTTSCSVHELQMAGGWSTQARITSVFPVFILFHGTPPWRPGLWISWTLWSENVAAAPRVMCILQSLSPTGTWGIWDAQMGQLCSATTRGSSSCK